MKPLRPLILAALLLAPLAARDTLGDTINRVGTVVATAKTVYAEVKNYYADAPKAVYVLKGGFIIVQTAVAKFKVTECPAINSHAWCATEVPKLRAYNAAAEQTIETARTFVLANPSLDASTLYNAAVTATEAYASFATSIGVPAS